MEHIETQIQTLNSIFNTICNAIKEKRNEFNWIK